LGFSRHNLLPNEYRPKIAFGGVLIAKILKRSEKNLLRQV
jgi:hypothetical protein